MVTNILGIVLFTLGIALTIGLHEAGHMLSARAFGMRVRRFFIGFGPKIISFRRGETEYALAALPLGGFCDIAGMTAMDSQLTAEEAPHAMYRKPWWQRIIVMSAGVVVNLILGVLIIYGIAMSSGIPDTRARVDELVCSADQRPDGSLAACSGVGPAGQAGIQPGDIITTVDGQDIDNFAQLRQEVSQRPGQTVTIGIERGQQLLDIEVQLDSVQRLNPAGELVTVGSIGMSSTPTNTVRTFGPVSAVGASLSYSGDILRATVQGIAQFPAKIPQVFASIFGAERALDSPVSVVGASRVGGELVERNMWAVFFSLLASLNFFLALFNLIPLPPFDGGHIAIICYEKLRDALRRSRGLAPMGPADYRRVMPLTYAMAAVLLSVGVVIIVADIVNPIRLFG